MTEKIIAAADGSALGNPGPAGWAWYIDRDNWAAGGWEHGTNNMGELKAVLDLFEATADRADEHLHVICDSQYTINSITKWMPGWKKKGWKKSDGKPVLNVDLMQALDRAIQGRSYSFEWVKGHTGHPLNEAADERANRAAQAYRDGTPVETGPGLESKHGLSSANSASLEPHSRGSEQSLAPQVSESDLDPVAEALAHEEQMLKPSIYGSEKLVGALIHPELTWVVPTGQVTDWATVLAYRERACAATGTPEILSSVALGQNAALLVSKVPTARGTLLRSSTWVLTGGSWKLRYRQDTTTRD
ncbi:ribonuclease HI family protein [Rothia nasimurium]|uniref:Ribonuclease H n=1 Tax=Rothia nasimurium TaxID=85336 RepID=A0A4Y9F2M8_9MICC|nr:ribonuclease HI family protein [Rothia nasimurium]MBF0808948.1 ribonuclease HI family protein [Rothia nasimurium]TFU21006.1 ribonuclease HI family protein [Rothia nasimurium]